MAAYVIPISLDSSEDSVCIVPADPLVAPEVGAVSVTLPVRVLDLVDYSSSSDSDPSKDSLPLAPELPLVSPFLCFDDSDADSESKPAEQRPERHESLTFHDAMVLRWRDEAASRPSSASRSSSHDTLASSSEFPLAPIVALPGIRRRPTILVRLGEAIPFGRPYRTHHNGSHRHSSPNFTSDSSSSGSSLNSSLDTSSGSPSDSMSDTSSVHSSGCDASALSTPYPSFTSESSLESSSKRSLDSSSPSAGPSHKRCKSPTTLVPSSTLVSRSIALTHADILPPRKRFRDPYSPKDSREEHMEIGTVDAEAVTDLGISDGVGVDTKDGIDNPNIADKASRKRSNAT
ncbi:hypothetical protein Tco_0347338 [Tanacetum coccineum]